MTRTVLLSFAHPDDESFICAGTVACLTAGGVTVAMATATLGEEGSAGSPPIAAREDLGRVRKAELQASCEILGIRDLHLLGYRDRQLAAAPPDEIRSRLVSLIRRYRPRIVITFDPNGVNGHPDHVAISRFTTDAIPAAADPRWYPEHGEPHPVPRLLWTTPTRVYHLARRPGVASDPGLDFLIDVRQWTGKKAASLRAHRTQHASIDRHFFNEPDCEALLGLEAFRQAFGPPLARRPSADIFEGLAWP